MPRKRSLVAPPESLAELFTDSRYVTLLAAVRSLPLRGTRQEIRARLRGECPEQPGVYGMVNAVGQLIYVGMSRSLKRRLLSYFASRISKKKEGRIGRRSATLIWQPAAHELIARLRERELIRKYRPDFNVQGHPTRMKLGYITLLDQPAGSFSLQARILKKHAGIWGPVPMTRFMRQAVQELNHQFLLRDCPKETPLRFEEDVPLIAGIEASACLRADLGTCLAPCIGGCSRSRYARSLSQAKQFLDGKTQTILDEMQSGMAAAVADRRYEKAAKLRDRWQALMRIDQHLRRFHDWTSQANFLYPLTSALDQRDWWLVVVRGVAIDAILRPRSQKERADVLQQLTEMKSQFCGHSSRIAVTGPDEFESARILYRWFRLFEEERPKRLSLAKARRLCQITRHGKKSR